MSNAPLMPMATAVWLVDNTTLSFKQIAEFCGLHEVEVQGIVRKSNNFPTKFRKSENFPKLGDAIPISKSETIYH